MIPQSELDRIEKEAEEKYPHEHKITPGHYDDFQDASRDGYIAGASSEYLRSASRMEWISVKKQLPEIGKWVFIATKHWRGVGKYQPDEGDDDLLWQDETTEFIDNAEVTHWQELPQPPQP